MSSAARARPSRFRMAAASEVFLRRGRLVSAHRGRDGSGRTTVLHVFSAMDPGGAELRTLEVVRRIPSDRFRTVFVTVSGRDGVLDDAIRAQGATIARVPFGVMFPWRFGRVLWRYRPDVVHSHIATNSGLPLLIAKVLRVRIRVAHFRSDGDPHGDGLRRRVQRRLMRRLIDASATSIVGVSPSALQGSWSAHWACDPRCRVMANGMDLGSMPAAGRRESIRADLGLSVGETVIAHVGRSTAEKNRVRAVEIFGEVSSRSTARTSKRLLLIGEMSDEERCLIDRRSHALNIHGQLIVLGFRDDVRELLLAADLLLLTSTREGLPGVVLEALAVGTPVVSAAVAGARWIGEQVVGVTVMDLSRPDSDWADAIEHVTLEEGCSSRRTAIREGFAAGPFLIERSVGALEQLWTA